MNVPTSVRCMALAIVDGGLNIDITVRITRSTT